MCGSHADTLLLKAEQRATQYFIVEPNELRKRLLENVKYVNMQCKSGSLESIRTCDDILYTAMCCLPYADCLVFN